MNPIIVEEIHRDRACLYCKMSEYRDNYDGRHFYKIEGTITHQVMDICEKCARLLYQLLGETVQAEG